MGIFLYPDATGSPTAFKISGDKPSATEMARINAYIAKSAPPAPAQTTPAKEPSGFIAGIKSGFHGAAEAGAAGIQGLAHALGSQGVEDWAKGAAAKEAEYAHEALPNPMTFDKASGIGDYLRMAAETVGQGIPYTAGALGGGALALAAAPEVAAAGGLGAAVVGSAGGAAAISPLVFGQNIERQKAENQGEIQDVGKAALWALPSALAQSAADMFTFKMTSLIGKGAAELAAKSVKQKAFGILQHAAASGGAGLAQAVGQSLMERVQAGLPIDDTEAFKEYQNAGVGGALAGGVLGGVFGGFAGVKTKKLSKAGQDQLDADLANEASNVGQPAESVEPFNAVGREKPTNSYDSAADQYRQPFGIQRINRAVLPAPTPTAAPFKVEPSHGGFSVVDSTGATYSTHWSAENANKTADSLNAPRNLEAYLGRAKAASEQIGPDGQPVALGPADYRGVFESPPFIPPVPKAPEANQGSPARIGGGKPEPFTQEHYDNAVKAINATGKGGFAVVQEATGLPKLPASMLWTKLKQDKVIIQKKPGAPWEASSKPQVGKPVQVQTSFEHLVKTVPTNNGEKFGVVQVQRAPDQSVVNEATVSVHDTQAEANAARKTAIDTQAKPPPQAIPQDEKPLTDKGFIPWIASHGKINPDSEGAAQLKDHVKGTKWAQVLFAKKGEGSTLDDLAIEATNNSYKYINKDRGEATPDDVVELVKKEIHEGPQTPMGYEAKPDLAKMREQDAQLELHRQEAADAVRKLGYTENPDIIEGAAHYLMSREVDSPTEAVERAVEDDANRYSLKKNIHAKFKKPAAPGDVGASGLSASLETPLKADIAGVRQEPSEASHVKPGAVRRVSQYGSPVPPVGVSEVAHARDPVKRAALAEKLRGHLNQLGLKDVGLKLYDIIKAPDKHSIVEGVYADKVIKLADGIYKDNLTEAELEAKLSSVLNHEIIHALKEMNLFSDKEWAALKKHAASASPVIDGKKRLYTYLDKAKKVYEGKPGYNEEAIAEEAIADAYRSWAADKKTVTGQPSGLFRRLINMIRQIGKAVQAEDVFGQIKSGWIGSRERGAAPAVAGGEKHAIIAWHGSPHEFDRFSTDKIGTGEGAQIKGHGLYFAGNKKVAQSYKEGLTTRTTFHMNGEKFDSFSDMMDHLGELADGQYVNQAIRGILSRKLADPSKSWDILASDYKANLRFPDAALESHREYRREEVDKAVKIIKDNQVDIQQKSEGGKLYQAKIEADPHEMMDYDLPLNEQSEYVKEKLWNIPWVADILSGETTHGMMAHEDSSYEIDLSGPIGEYLAPTNIDEAWQLRDAGVKGIKYKDAWSRGPDAADHSYNYVVFHDNDISISGKFALIHRQEAHADISPSDSDWRNITYATAKYSMNAEPGQRVPVAPKGLDMEIMYNHVGKFMDKWFGGAVEKLGGNREHFKSNVEGLQAYFQDKMIPVGRLIDWVKEHGGKIYDGSDPKMWHQLMSSSIGAAIEARHKEGGLYHNAAKSMKNLGFTKADMTELMTSGPKSASTFLGSATYKDRSSNLAMVDLYLFSKAAPHRNARLLKSGIGRDEWVVKPHDKTKERVYKTEAEAKTVADKIGGDVEFRKGVPGSGISNEDAAAIQAWFDKHPLRAKLQHTEGEIRKVIADTNKWRTEHGLIPLDLEGEPDYVPMRGHLDEDMEDTGEMIDPHIDSEVARTGKGVQIRGREDRRAFGRRTLPSDIFNHIILQNEESIARANKNDVGNAFGKMIEDNKEILKGVAEIVHDQDNGIANLPMKPVFINGQKRMIVDPMYKNDRHIYTYKRDGKDISVNIYDARIADAMKGTLRADSQNLFLKGLMHVNKWLANASITFNPEFILTNFERDLTAAGILINQYGGKGLTKDMFGNIKQSFKAVSASLRDGKWGDPAWKSAYDEYINAGGGTRFYGLRNLHDTIHATEKILRTDLSGGSSEVMNASKKAFASVGKFIRDYNQAFEETTRLSVYKTLRDRGASVQRAAQAAKSITVDFNAGGNGKLLMNSMYLFYNAGIQGTMALINGAAKSRRIRKTMAVLAGAGVAQDLMNYTLSETDDDGKAIYDKIPQYQLEHNMIFIDPTGLSKRGYFMIPLPYGFNAFFNAGRAASQMMRGGVKVGAGVGSMMGAAVDAFNPISGTNSFLNFIAPTVVDPFVDLARNKDFAGRPIEPDQSGFGPPRPEHMLYWNNTHPAYKEVAKLLSEATGGTSVLSGGIEVSPEVLQYWTEYIGGGAMSFVRRATDLPFSTIPKMASGEWGDISMNDIPFLRRSVGNISTRNDMESYVENRDKVLSVRSEVRKAFAAGDTDRAQQAMADHPEEFKMSGIINNINSQRSHLKIQEAKIRDNIRIPDSQKELLLKNLHDREDALVARANKIMANL